MPKIEITTDEQTMILNSLANELKSAKRAQNSSKTPQIREVYVTHERVIQQLQLKIGAAK